MKSTPTRIVRTGLLGLLLCGFLMGDTLLHAQCDKLAARCEDNLVEFISDGQYYRASVKDATEASIKITLYEGFRYRIVVCNDRPGAKVRYRVMDGSKAEVFESMAAKDGDYWDFELESTDNFTIKASIPNNVGMGCILFSVGYDDELMLDDDAFEEEDDPFFEDELDYDELEEEDEN
jgi:hypothetical protein